MPVPASSPPPTVASEVREDRRDHERRHGPQQLDDREHPLEVGRGQREAGHEQRGRDGRAEADAGEARADQGRRFARRHLRRGRPRSQPRETAIPSQRQVVERALTEHHAEHDRGDHRAGDLGQVQEPDVERPVVLQQHRRGQRGRRHRRGCGEQRDRDPGHRHRAGQHRADRQQRLLGAVLVDDQRDDRGQPAEQRHERQGVEKAVGQQLRCAEERGHAAHGRQRDRAQIAGRVGVCRRRVLERQQRQDQRAQGDRGDDPEQRPPVPELAWSPPMRGPSATAPKMHMFMITAVSRSLVAG